MEIRSGTGLAAQIAATLRQRILAGELAPGAQLRQDRIAAEFGASHIPVREAFRNLEREGLVEHQPRRGSFVAPLYPGEPEEVMLMRIALEPLAIRLAVPKLSDADLDAARGAADAIATAPGFVERRAANWAFHRALYAACERRRIIATIENLWLQVDRYYAMVWHLTDSDVELQADHAQILQAAAAGDGARAAALTRTHVEGAGKALTDLLNQPPSGTSMTAAAARE